MVTYQGVAFNQVGGFLVGGNLIGQVLSMQTADNTEVKGAEFSGTNHDGLLLTPSPFADSFTPFIDRGGGRRMDVGNFFRGTIADSLSPLTGTTHEGKLLTLKALLRGTTTSFGNYFLTGLVHMGRVVGPVSAFSTADRLTLAGRAETVEGNLLVDYGILFEGNQIVGNFSGARTNGEGEYTTNLIPGDDYTIKAFSADKCSIYELDRIEEEIDPDTGGLLKVLIFDIADACDFSKVQLDGGDALETADDVLNREIGYHAYEPVRTEVTIRPGSNYLVHQELAITTAMSDTILNETITTPVTLAHILVAGECDGRITVKVNNIPVLPTMLINVNEPNVDILGGAPISLVEDDVLTVDIENVSENNATYQVTAIGTVL